MLYCLFNRIYINLDNIGLILLRDDGFEIRFKWGIETMVFDDLWFQKEINNYLDIKSCREKCYEQMNNLIEAWKGYNDERRTY